MWSFVKYRMIKYGSSIRQMPVKVLAISGHAVQGYDILKIAAIFGAHGTLENPFSVDRLLLGVRALIGPAHPHVA